MIENDENSSNYCKYCGCKFQQDTIQRLIGNKELVICEFCGIEINIDNVDTQEGFVKDQHEKTLILKEDIKKKKMSIVKRIGKLAKSRKFSVNIILNDEDFTQIFKEILIIVISRLIYFSLGEWEQENNVSVRRVSLNQSILTYLASKLKPILTKRISRTFLENLHNISIEEFDDSLKLLQKKVESNQDYRTHFLTFIIWLKKIVFRLVSDMWEMKNLPKFQATILKDLKNYFIGHDLSKNKKTIQCEKYMYPTIKFIEDLRKELQKIIPKKELLHRKRLSEINLSSYLGQKENHIYQIKRNCKRNPKFLLDLNLIREYKRYLTSRFGDRCNRAKNLIKRYKSLNSLKEDYEHIYDYHPNIKLDYFKDINTKPKAYWLGFIYSDGGLSYQFRDKKFIRFHFGLNIKDKDSRDMVYRLANTIGIEEKYVKPCSRGILLRFMITNNRFAMHLNNHGVIIGKKSKKIELPELGNRELNLAFLLGYYDGDGTEGSTVISSGSKKFLEQIKKKYEISYDLRYKKGESIINGKKVKGEGWDLALGANLFNEMMRNYQFSMPRKRKIFETPEERSERMRQTCIDRAKLKITDDFLKDLKKLVWEMPLYKIAEKYEISNSRITEVCKKYEISKPPVGYWRKKHN